MSIKILSPTAKEEHLVRDTRREYGVPKFDRKIAFGSLTLIINLSKPGRGRYVIEEKCKRGYEGAYAKCVSDSVMKRCMIKKEREIALNIINENNISLAVKRLITIPNASLYNSVCRCRIVAPKLTDYYLNTICIFKPVATGEYSNVNEKWEKLKLESRFEHHESPCRGSISEYLVDAKSGDIFRFSDHWGKCASCTWDLDVENKNYYDIDEKSYEEMAIGVANLNEFKRKEYYYVQTKSAEAAKMLLSDMENNVKKLNSLLNDNAAKITEKSRNILQAITNDSMTIIKHLNKGHYRVCETLCKEYVDKIYSISLKS